MSQARWSALFVAFFLILRFTYAEEVLVTKAFSVKFKELDQAASIVNNLLSDRGAVTMQPKLRTLIVQDLNGNMRRIESAIAAFDVPPPSVEIAVKLVRAEKAAAANAVSDEIKGMAKIGEVLKFNQYSLLGSSVIQSQEGHDAVITLADDYQVSFVTDVIQEGNGIIRLKNLQLKKRKKDAQGKDVFTALMTITLNLRNAETLVLGATRFEDSSQALLMILRGTVKR